MSCLAFAYMELGDIGADLGEVWEMAERLADDAD